MQILKFMFSVTNTIIYELCIHGVCPTMNKRFKKMNYCVHLVLGVDFNEFVVTCQVSLVG